MRRWRFAVGSLAVWIILSRVDALTAEAQTPCAAPACAGLANCIVDGLSGVNGPGCCTTACKTIQFAVGEVSAGAVIKVAAGTYPENAASPLMITTTVTLCGAKAGVDARTRSGPESIITDTRGTILNASNIIIDGFTFEGDTSSIFPFGLDMGQGTEGAQVYNNIFQNNVAGIGLANTGPSQARICQNLLQNDNNPGSPSGDGIYTDEFVCGIAGGNACTNFLIEQNAFKGNTDAGIDLSNTAANAMTNVTISANTFDMNGRAVLLFNVDQSAIQNNVITNSTTAGSGAIRIFGGTAGLTITNNDMNGGAGWAIRMTNDNGPSSDIVIHENNIANFAGAGGMFGGGLQVEAGAYPGTLDATCNWWNDPCGPFNVTNNPSGIGQEVEEGVPSNVSFSPWLIAPGPAPASGTGTCSGTAGTCRATTTTTTTPSSTLPTTTTTPVTTTTTMVVPSTSTTLPPEICAPLTVTQSSFRPAKSRLRVHATFPDGTFAGLDPRRQGVQLQVRSASGALVSCTIPAADWQRLFQTTFGFFDQQLTVCPPIKCMRLALPTNGQPATTIIAAGVTPGSPLLSPVEITVKVDDQCAAGPLSPPQKATVGTVFP
jgi:hypothetical protein